MLKKIWRILESWRLGRVIMLGMVSGSTAYGFGAERREVIIACLVAAFLALGGFYIDYLADWKQDRVSGKILNPIASGDISPRMGWVFVLTGVLASAAFSFVLEPWLLIPVAGVVGTVSGMAVGVLNTPLLRTFSLGALQGFYVLIGGIVARGNPVGLILCALFLFFAMTGGRIMGEVRDLPYDQQVDTLTFPQKYGIRRSVLFLIINQLIAYVFALSVYWSGALGRSYFYCMLGTIFLGSAINLVFAIRPTPQVAYRTNMLSLAFLGGLFILGMVLGRL